MSRARLYFLGLLLLALLASSVGAQIYRWVDEKGTVHFSDERPRNVPGVKEVVEAGARRTPMVRGGPEWRVDTPTPGSFDRTARGDDFYDDEYDDAYDDYYDGEGSYYGGPSQGDTIIQVYEPPPWFDEGKRRHHRDRHGAGDRGRNRGRGHEPTRDGRGRGNRNRAPRPVGAAAPPPGNVAPPVARPPGRTSSRAMPLPR